MRNNKKGFTLAELLIVVAIIAVLVAVAIPIFTSQLEKSREATDMANLRGAKAEAVAMYLTNDLAEGVYVFDPQAGTLKPTSATGFEWNTAWACKGTANNPGTFTADNNEYAYLSSTNYADTSAPNYILVTYKVATDGDELYVFCGPTSSTTASHPAKAVNFANSSTTVVTTP